MNNFKLQVLCMPSGQSLVNPRRSIFVKVSHQMMALSGLFTLEEMCLQMLGRNDIPIDVLPPLLKNTVTKYRQILYYNRVAPIMRVTLYDHYQMRNIDQLQEDLLEVFESDREDRCFVVNEPKCMVAYIDVSTVETDQFYIIPCTCSTLQSSDILDFIAQLTGATVFACDVYNIDVKVTIPAVVSGRRFGLKYRYLGDIPVLPKAIMRLRQYVPYYKADVFCELFEFCDNDAEMHLHRIIYKGRI